ncbi:hypothetical protein [Mangrovibacterium diazotrophicum]|uniref:Glycoside hydrolase family 65 n=1 Tax=Mangrovibacterium diazotrophicum TaxID=1261403 RepID=A0A419W613_9BACT|nr:hypothetical protein [Mangrovibacterium diazotrophicum]RKD90887.1 hypothetical protein BC643_1232 [Mangrovibacterium diazotrophicum]
MHPQKYSSIFTFFLLVFLHTSVGAYATTPKPIDRHALVTRHNIRWPWEERGQIPMGNGEFCIGVDGTGLQTFGGNTMSHWGWHSFPLPQGISPDQIPPTGSFINVKNGDHYIGPDTIPTGKQAIANWMYDNPHIVNLGRLRFVRYDGAELTVEDITSNAKRSIDLWTGTHTTSFVVSGEWINKGVWVNPAEMGGSGQQVTVTTYVHPHTDQVSVRVESDLIANGIIKVALDFPYPTLNNEIEWVGDFKRTENNLTTLTQTSKVRADFTRQVDDFTYHVAMSYSEGAKVTSSIFDGDKVWYLDGNGLSTLEFSTTYSPNPIGDIIADFESTREANKVYWENFWMNGGAIDLSESTDPRWFELERRIVLSQYLTAVQAAGSWPSSESGLMNIDPWRGQFHFEIIFFHQAHFALWDRWQLTDEAVRAYQHFVPTARARAKQFGFKGLEWPKSATPSGRSAPWEGNQALLWKQPQPLHFAELEYRLNPTGETLEKWAEVVFGTVDYMVDFLTLDKETETYHIELNMGRGEWGESRDNPQVLAFWHWGIEQGQTWRERMGLGREPNWDKVLNHLVKFPIKDGIYVDSQGRPLRLTGILGLMPPSEAITLETATRTYAKMKEMISQSSEGAFGSRNMGWGVAMGAVGQAKMGDAEGAVESLLGGLGTAFDIAGINRGLGGAYLPTNGALLYAAAVMAAGWDGAPDRNAPGFPDDGSWIVRWEGLKRAP